MKRIDFIKTKVRNFIQPDSIYNRGVPLFDFEENIRDLLNWLS